MGLVAPLLGNTLSGAILHAVHPLRVCVCVCVCVCLLVICLCLTGDKAYCFQNEDLKDECEEWGTRQNCRGRERQSILEG